VKNLNKAKFEI